MLQYFGLLLLPYDQNMTIGRFHVIEFKLPANFS